MTDFYAGMALGCSVGLITGWAFTLWWLARFDEDEHQDG